MLDRSQGGELRVSWCVVGNSALPSYESVRLIGGDQSWQRPKLR